MRIRYNKVNLIHTVFLLYLKDLLQLVLSPLHGWEDVSFDGYSSRKLLLYGFIPLMAVTAGSVFLESLYHADITFVLLLQQAIVTFLKFFASYYLACFSFSLLMPLCTDGNVSSNKNHTFIIYSLSLLALIDLLGNCIPMELSLIYLMPLYALYIMWRGLRYLAISFSGVGNFLLLCVFTVLLPPYLIQLLFGLLIKYQ